MPITCIPYPVAPNVAAKTTVSSSTAVTYTVPAGSTGIYVYLWGGAGGYGNQPNGMGGSGGFVSGFYSCSAGTVLSVILGRSGGAGGGAGQGTILTGGGSGGGGSFCVGGGFAGIFNSTTTAAASQANAIAIAGGGGGSGQYGSANGGGGGYPSGTAAIINAYGGNAGPGTQSGPGTGDGGTGTGMIGSNGGGGGYFGGGGTAFGGGGGGSSYIGGFTSLAYYENGSNATAYNQATPVYPGGTTNTYYVSPAGQALNSSFNIGLVVIIPAAAVTPTGQPAIRIPLTLSTFQSRVINSYTGNYILYTVPTGITSLIFNMWGAGGPGSGGQPGGGGAFLTGTLATTPGEQLRLIVGQGGKIGTATYSNTLPDYQGAGGGGGGLAGSGGQGGGRSAIQKYITGAWTEIVTAGGGGSAGGNAGTYGGNAYYTGTSQSAGTTYGQGRIPTGGSASAGGLGTFTANTGAPYNGTQFTGGAASNAFNVSPVTGPCGGGGGGGGYYGGGGGGRSGADTYGGGGGGSYYNATYVTNFSGSNGNGTTQIASTIPGYMTNIGTGSTGGSTNGNNGLVIFNVAYTKSQATTVPFPPIYTNFAYTGSNQTYTVPAGVTTITVHIWGAGGGQGTQTPAQEYGGAGAYVTGSLTVTPGSTFIVLVGGGGNSSGGATSGQGGFGGGGSSSQQAGGGGRSAIQRTLTATISSASGASSVVTYTTSVAHGLAVGQPVIITGLSPAGYNGTYIVASVAPTTFTVSNATTGTSSGTGTIVAELADAGGGGGGAGWATAAGGAAAWTGTASDGTSPGGGVNGKGASQTAGGAATSGSQGESFAGTALQGGAQTYQGGAGGGGYYGGGAGAGNSYNHGGGGGGSSYTALLTGATGQNGSGSLPPTTGFTNLPAGTATGGMVSGSSTGTKAGNGYVMISYPRTT